MANASGYSGRTNGGQFDFGNTEGLKQFGFGVGSIPFLDSEDSRVSRYWRAIEVGSSKMEGKFLGGGWAGPGGGRGARHGQDLTPFGEGSGQQFIPYSHTMSPTPEGAFFSARVARRLMREQGLRNPLATGYIHNPIPAHDAYGKAFKAFNATAKEMEIITRLFGEILATGKGRPINVSGVTVGSLPDFLAVGVVSAPNLQLLADAFGKARSQLNDLNRELAAELAAVVADELVLVRPDASSGHLKEAILDRRNRFPQ